MCSNLCVVWWSVLWVTFTGHRVPKLTLLLPMPVQVFQEEISIWMDRLSKVDCPPPCGWTSFIPLRTWMEKKVEEGGIFFFPASLLSWTISLFLALSLGFTPSGNQVLRLSELDWITPWLSWVSRLETEDSGPSQPPQLQEPIAHNKFLSPIKPHYSVSLGTLTNILF